MNISIFTAVTSPSKRGDNPGPAFKCYSELADEVVTIDGAYINGPDMRFRKGNQTIYSYWPKEFDWQFIGQQFQKGYANATGDWVLHMDLDFIFHERDYGRIRQALKDYPSAPAVSFYKWQFILPDRYNLKSRLVLAVNKKKFGDRIKFNGGGDLCQPTLDGVDLDLNEIPQAGVPFYNYEKLTKTKEQVKDDVERMDRAYHTHFGKWLYSEDGVGAYEGWLHMVVGRFGKPQREIALHEHPKVMQEVIRNLKPEQFGYNGFGYLPQNNYVT